MMMNKQRFNLKSYNFNKLEGVLYDNLLEKELHLSLYEIVDLLNEFSQKEYDLKQYELKQLEKNIEEYLDK